MKYTEILGEYELIYEGEPKEIAELQNLINPKILTIEDKNSNGLVDIKLIPTEDLVNALCGRKISSYAEAERYRNLLFPYVAGR